MIIWGSDPIQRCCVAVAVPQRGQTPLQNCDVAVINSTKGSDPITECYVAVTSLQWGLTPVFYVRFIKLSCNTQRSQHCAVDNACQLEAVGLAERIDGVDCAVAGDAVNRTGVVARLV